MVILYKEMKELCYFVKRSKHYSNISIQPLAKRFFSFIYPFARTRHHYSLFLLYKLHFLRRLTNSTSDLAKIKSTSPISSFKLNSHFSVPRFLARWYLFPQQHVTPFPSFHIAPHSNRYHFGGMSRTFCTSMCSLPLTSPLVFCFYFTFTPVKYRNLHHLQPHFTFVPM